jgi:hypothetical protein
LKFNFAKGESMQKFVALIVFLGLLSLPLMAQDKVEVFGGYQYLHIGNITADGQTLTNSSQSFNGWDASATYYFGKFIGVQGDFGGSYATIGGVSTHVYTYSGGPVVAFRHGPINPFVHAVFGGIDLGGSESGVSVSRTGFTTMVGGGVDVKVAHHLSVRPIGVDWLYYHFGSSVIDGVGVPSFSQSNNVRITAGIVLRF